MKIKYNKVLKLKRDSTVFSAVKMFFRTVISIKCLFLLGQMNNMVRFSKCKGT